MESLKGSIVITPKDIQLIIGKCIVTARKELKAIKDILQKKKITVQEYCEYEKLDLETVIRCLNKYR